MTVDGLIASLKEVKTMHGGSAPIYISSDEEGNSYGDLGKGQLQIGMIADEEPSRGIVIFPVSSVLPEDL